MCSRIVAVVSLICLASICRAELKFESDATSYTLDSLGKASVKIYLAETGGTFLSDNGGINSTGFAIIPGVGGSVLTLESINAAPGFDHASPNLAAGSLYLELADLNAGVLPGPGNRVELGTFTYFGPTTGIESAVDFTIQDPSSDQSYTASGLSIDNTIGAGSFTIVVPEPTTIGLLFVPAMLLRRRRRA